jgi:putative transposase
MAAWLGAVATWVAVPSSNTSRTCRSCGHICALNQPTQARFPCVACQYENHADLVGAIDILRAGHARCACEVNAHGRQQQDPTEAVAMRLDAVLQAQ